MQHIHTWKTDIWVTNIHLNSKVFETRRFFDKKSGRFRKDAVNALDYAVREVVKYFGENESSRTLLMASDRIIEAFESEPITSRLSAQKIFLANEMLGHTTPVKFNTEIPDDETYKSLIILGDVSPGRMIYARAAIMEFMLANRPVIFCGREPPKIPGYSWIIKTIVAPDDVRDGIEDMLWHLAHYRRIVGLAAVRAIHPEDTRQIGWFYPGVVDEKAIAKISKRIANRFGVGLVEAEFDEETVEVYARSSGYATRIMSRIANRRRAREER